MKDLVTIIMPVYNTEQYLQRAIDSVELQSHPSIELIIVDDCSPDNSSIIYEAACLQYDNIRVIKHESNRGLVSTRNTGLLEAKGNWVCFLDSDDILYPDAISTMLERVNDSIEVILGSFNRNIDGAISCEYSNILSDGIYSKQAVVKMLFDVLPLNVLSCIGTKLYRVDTLKNNAISFDNSYLYNEDLAFIIDVLMVVDSIAYIDKPVYEYIIRNNGSIQTSYRKHFLANISTTRKKLYTLFEQADCLDEKQNALDEMWFGLTTAAVIQEFKYNKSVSETFSDVKQVQCISDSIVQYQPTDKTGKLIKKAIMTDNSTELLDYLNRKSAVNVLKKRLKQILKRK